MLRTHGSDRPARGAGAAGRGELVNEEILEQPGRRVAVESQLLLGHLSVILRWDQIARS